MNRYPEYKESGVEWLGEVPAHWPLTKLKHAAVVNPTKGASDYERDADERVTFLPMESVSEDGVIDTSIQRPINELWSGFTYFEENDTIVAKITPCFENGKGAHLQQLGSPIGFGSTEFHVLRPRFGVSNGRFLYYLTHSQVFRTPGEAFMTGAAGQKRVPTGFVEEFEFALPPVAEQSAIVDFLDRKTAQIGTLIQKKQVLIDLLREQRAALVNRAVTKGLNPDAPMKDSGIEWLGAMPEHWRATRLKFVSSFITSGSRGWAEFYSDTGPIFIRIGNLTRDSIRLDLGDVQRVSPPSGSEGERTRVQAGDVLVSITAFIGSVAVVPQEIEEAYVNQHVALCRPLDQLVLPEWIGYALLSSIGQAQFGAVLYGGTKAGLNLSDVADLWVPVPPVEEQHAISERLARITDQVDDLIRREHDMVSHLRELRTSLVSEVVTGKIDVRNSRLVPDEGGAEDIAA